MLFSVNYKSKHKQEADEIRCPFNQLGQIYSFMKENPDKRYVILVPKTTEDLDKAIQQTDLVKAITPNYTVCCEDILHLHTFNKANYNCYLRPALTDWESFQLARSRNLTDIYIDGPLGFQLDQIAEAKGDAKIRCSPTISPNTILSANRPLNSFYIRPEDLDLYSSAIDIIDFNVTSQDKEDLLFRIYKRGTFNYDINVIIPGLPQLNNLLFQKDFADHRLNCGQRCRRPNRSCHYCETFFNVNSLLMQDLAYRRKKKAEKEQDSSLSEHS